jgi:hypothetical protein
MTSSEAAAYIQAQAISARIKLESMICANDEALRNGEDYKYHEEDFLALENDFVIGHNGVIGCFNMVLV